jgi:hypothetical protein
LAWLRISCALISLCIYLYLALQASRFKKEFKGAIQEDRTLSNAFVKKWDRRLSRNIVLIIIATFFGLVAAIITDL